MRTGLARAVLSTRALAFAAVAACGGTSTHTSETGLQHGDDASTGPFVEAAHAPLPQVVFHGGPMLTTPKIVTVTFPGEANADALEAFGDTITTTDWWAAATSSLCNDTGNCIGQGTSGGHVRLTSPPAASYSDATGGGTSTLQVYIAGLVQSGLLPAPDANTLYVFYFPASSLITLTESNTQIVSSCNQFQAYHNTFESQTMSAVAYAIVQECAPAAGLTPLQALTFQASHEIVEASSDPAQQTLGYYLDLTDTSVLGWDLVIGGELADLCVDVSGLHQDRTAADGYTLQRIWSNANAARGIDPCIPSLAPDVYFNVAPTSSYFVLRVGGQTTFELDAFSTAATDPWTVEAIDWATEQGMVKAPLLNFSFNGASTATVTNGDKVAVTVSLNADPGQLRGAEGVFFSVAGSLTAPTAAHIWPILVVTPDVAGGGS